MKLRFGIDAAARERIRARLDALSGAPPEGRRLSEIYLDTPEGELAAHGVALRFRSRVALGEGRRRGAVCNWRRQEVWSKRPASKGSASPA